MIPNKNIKYTGIDFSLKQLEKAKEYLKDNQMKAKLIKSEVSNLKEIKDNTFDCGLFIAALHCIETPEKRKIKLLFGVTLQRKHFPYGLPRVTKTGRLRHNS